MAKEDEGTGGAADYLSGRKLATNAVTGAVLAPYEIVFHGFSTELAAVLEGFYRSPNCFIVKNIDVQTNVVVASVGEFVPSYVPYSFTPGVPPPVLNPYDQMRMRYGSRYNRMPNMPIRSGGNQPAFGWIGREMETAPSEGDSRPQKQEHRRDLQSDHDR